MEKFILELGVILVGSAILSCFAVLFKQPIVIAYIVCGIVVGPWGMGWIKNAESIEMISHIGITLLLFLAGLCLHPQKLLELFKKTSLVTVGNSLGSFLLAFAVSLLFKFKMTDSLCIGMAMMFSSTILAVKLLPTTRLHQERMGAICIGVLILQDLMAIIVLALMRCLNAPQGIGISFGVLLFKLILFIAILMLLEQFVLRRIMHYMDRLQEALFILGLAWCFGIAGISNSMGLFYETGAFFAGVVIARHRISFFISEKLKPLRDFFLVLFFFSLGAKLDFLLMQEVVVPAIVLTLLFIILKPWLFKKLFILTGEKPHFAREMGFRLGQLSEFSLLIAILALELGHISAAAFELIQLVTIATFIMSSYVVVLNFPTPIGTTEKLIRD